MPRASLVAQLVKNLPAMQETWIQSLSWEDPLEKEMAIHSSILACEILGTEESGRLQSMGLQRVGNNLVTKPLPLLQRSRLELLRSSCSQTQREIYKYILTESKAVCLDV